jgi:hypothetical protein
MRRRQRPNQRERKRTAMGPVAARAAPLLPGGAGGRLEAGAWIGLFG